MNVLIIEDDFSDAALLRRIIHRNPAYKLIEIACCIQEAKKKISNDQFNFIVLDLKLPENQGELLNENGGNQILEFIRNEIPYSKKPVIIVVSVFKEDSTQALRIKESGLFELITAWFNKIDDFQKISKFFSAESFKSATSTK